jgi:ABC-type lipoprotein release transport system permease subunit
MPGEELVRRFLERRVLTEKNIERFVKYYWLVSTARMVLGVTILILILIGGLEFGQLIPWR